MSVGGFRRSSGGDFWRGVAFPNVGCRVVGFVGDHDVGDGGS